MATLAAGSAQATQEGVTKPSGKPGGPLDGELIEQLESQTTCEAADVAQVVWARVKGYPWWPAQVLSSSEARARLAGVQQRKLHTVAVMFFGTQELAWMAEKDVATWKAGMGTKYYVKGKNGKFTLALAQVRDFLHPCKKRKAPEEWWCRPPAPPRKPKLAPAAEPSPPAARVKAEPASAPARQSRTQPPPAQPKAPAPAPPALAPAQPAAAAAEAAPGAATDAAPVLPPAVDAAAPVSAQQLQQLAAVLQQAPGAPASAPGADAQVKAEAAVPAPADGTVAATGDPKAGLRMFSEATEGMVAQEGVLWPEEGPLLLDQPEPFQLPGSYFANRRPQYEHVRTCIWVSRPRPKRLPKDQVSACSCANPREGDEGCGDGCLNRLSYLHCDAKSCPCGRACGNRPFHQLRPPKMDVFLTDNRGWGVRAAEWIPKGSFIVEYCGEVIDEVELRRRMEAAREEGEQHYYIMELQAGLFIDARSKGNLARLLNSSCAPNCETQKWTDSATNERRIGIFATEDIPPGQELTYDYKFEHYGLAETLGSFRCMCGAPSCRGTMDVNPDKRRDYGRRLEVFWDGDGVYYRGTVIGFTATSRKHTVLYDDGETEKVQLDSVPHRWLDPEASPRSAARAPSPVIPGSARGPRPSPKHPAAPSDSSSASGPQHPAASPDPHPDTPTAKRSRTLLDPASATPRSRRARFPHPDQPPLPSEPAIKPESASTTPPSSPPRSETDELPIKPPRIRTTPGARCAPSPVCPAGHPHPPPIPPLDPAAPSPTPPAPPPNDSLPAAPSTADPTAAASPPAALTATTTPKPPSPPPSVSTTEPRTFLAPAASTPPPHTSEAAPSLPAPSEPPATPSAPSSSPTQPDSHPTQPATTLASSSGTGLPPPAMVAEAHAAAEVAAPSDVQTREGDGVEGKPAIAGTGGTAGVASVPGTVQVAKGGGIPAEAVGAGAAVSGSSAWAADAAGDVAEAGGAWDALVTAAVAAEAAVEASAPMEVDSAAADAGAPMEVDSAAAEASAPASSSPDAAAAAATAAADPAAATASGAAAVPALAAHAARGAAEAEVAADTRAAPAAALAAGAAAVAVAAAGADADTGKGEGEGEARGSPAGPGDALNTNSHVSSTSSQSACHVSTASATSARSDHAASAAAAAGGPRASPAAAPPSTAADSCLGKLPTEPRTTSPPPATAPATTPPPRTRSPIPSPQAPPSSKPSTPTPEQPSTCPNPPPGPSSAPARNPHPRHPSPTPLASPPNTIPKSRRKRKSARDLQPQSAPQIRRTSTPSSRPLAHKGLPNVLKNYPILNLLDNCLPSHFSLTPPALHRPVGSPMLPAAALGPQFTSPASPPTTGLLLASSSRDAAPADAIRSPHPHSRLQHHLPSASHTNPLHPHWPHYHYPHAILHQQQPRPNPNPLDPTGPGSCPDDPVMLHRHPAPHHRTSPPGPETTPQHSPPPTARQSPLGAAQQQPPLPSHASYPHAALAALAAAHHEALLAAKPPGTLPRDHPSMQAALTHVFHNFLQQPFPPDKAQSLHSLMQPLLSSPPGASDPTTLHPATQPRSTPPHDAAPANPHRHQAALAALANANTPAPGPSAAAPTPPPHTHAATMEALQHVIASRAAAGSGPGITLPPGASCFSAASSAQAATLAAGADAASLACTAEQVREQLERILGHTAGH